MNTTTTEQDKRSAHTEAQARRRVEIKPIIYTHVIRIHDPPTSRQLAFLKYLRDCIGDNEYQALYKFPERDERRLTRGQVGELIDTAIKRKRQIEELFG